MNYAPATLTVPATDISEELDLLINEAVIDHHCHDLTLMSYRQHGMNQTLTYVVTYEQRTGYMDRDEDGAYRDTQTVTDALSVTVPLWATDSAVVEAVAAGVRGMEGNDWN